MTPLPPHTHTHTHTHTHHLWFFINPFFDTNVGFLISKFVNIIIVKVLVWFTHFLLWKKCINICCWIYVSLYLHFYLYLRGCFAPFSFCGRCDGKIAAGELILLLLLCSNCKKCSNCKNCFNTILLESWTCQKFHLLWNGKNIKCEIFFP